MSDLRPPVLEAAEARAAEPPQSAALRARALEDRLRFAYLRRFPAPLLGWVDPPLRAATGLVRRAAATPIYLRQELAAWTGTLAGEPLQITTWGKRETPRLLFPLLFDDEPTVEWKGRRTLRQVLRREVRGAARVLIAETTPALAPLLRRAGCWIVPALVRLAAETRVTLAAREGSSHSLKSDRRRMLREGLRLEVRTYTPERSATFYRRYLLPHVRSRYAGREEPTSFAAVDRQFAAGFSLAVLHPDRSEPDAIAILYPRGDTLFLSKLGVLDGDPELIRSGRTAAIYDHAPELAESRGLGFIDVGRALPWRGNGVTLYKWKWGYRPVLDTGQTLEFAIHVAGEGAQAVRRRLADRQLIVRTGRGFLIHTSEGWMRPDESLSWPGGSR